MEQPKEQPMITVKQAAELLNVDPRTIREKLATKQLRGEKRLYGLREKWYVNKSDVEALVQEQHDRAEELHETRVDTKDIENLFDSENEEDAIDIDEVEPMVSRQETSQNLEVLVRAITKQFSEELSTQKEIVVELKKELEDKERQLKLLPDLEKQAIEKQKEAELREFEKQALEKQLDLIKQEREKKDLETKEELDNLAEKEKQLQSELKSFEKEKEISKENESKLRTEFEELQKELASKQQEIEVLKKPWWKKWFLPAEAETP